MQIRNLCKCVCVCDWGGGGGTYVCIAGVIFFFFLIILSDQRMGRSPESRDWSAVMPNVWIVSLG